MNTKSLILKKGLFQNKLLFAIPLMVSLLQAPPNRERHSIIFFGKKLFQTTNSQRVGLLIDLQRGLIF